MGSLQPWRRRVLLIGLLAVAGLAGPGPGLAARMDSGVLNQAQFTNASGYGGGGPQLSTLSVTSYSDGTVSFGLQFANRAYLEPGETVQIFVDLNDDGTPDLNFSVWPSFEPSYLDRWTGTGWTDIRQLPELVQSPGSVSVRLSLSELQGDGAVPVAPTIQVAAGSWTANADGSIPAGADDWIPSASSWDDFSIMPVAATPTAPATTTASPGGAGRTPPASTSRGAAATGAGAGTLPVTIEPLAPLTIKPGRDVTLHILLRSTAGPARLFKVCTAVPPSSGVVNLTQCRSTESTGAHGPVPLAITYRLDRPGTTRIAVAASAGTAKATATAVVHVAG